MVALTIPNSSGTETITGDNGQTTDLTWTLNNASGGVGGSNSVSLGGASFAPSGELAIQTDFSVAVENMQFTIADVDESVGIWDDQIRVEAFDANGNPVAINFSGTTTGHVVEEDGANGVLQIEGSNTVENDESSINVTIPGPVSQVIIYYEDGGTTTNDFGAIRLESLSFTDVVEPDGTVSGTSGDDVIDASYTDSTDGDQIDANDGTNGTAGDQDLVEAGAGNDIVMSGASEDTIFGGSGNDQLGGNGGDDSISGDAGNDTIEGGFGDDTLEGGSGDDQLTGGGTASAEPVAGENGVPSQPTGGQDDLNYNTSATAEQMSDVLFGEGFTINSASLTGNAVQSAIYTGGDTLSPDTMPSETGIILSTGNTTQFNDENETNENLSSNLGGAGDADVNVASGTTSFDATSLVVDFTADQTGTVTIDLSFLTDEYPTYLNSGVSDVGAVFIDTGDGNGFQLVPLEGTSLGYADVDSLPNQTFLDNSTASEVYNTDFNAIQNLSASLDLIAGESYTLKLVVADVGDGELDSSLVLGSNAFQFEDNGSDSLSGGAGNDILEGEAGSDKLDGGTGTDSLYGGGDDDDLTVGASDLAEGGGGDDVFTIDTSTGDTGTITIVGGETDEGGSDTSNDNFPSAPNATGDVLDLRGLLNSDGLPISSKNVLFSGGNDEAGTLTLLDGTVVNFSEIENIIYTPTDGTVSGTSGDDVIDGSYVDPTDGDEIDSNDGKNGTTGDQDVVKAGAGNDSVNAGAAEDTVYGGSGNDTLDGGGGSDTLFGDEGDDVLIGSSAETTMYGGDDADTFIVGVGNDTIEGGEGGDDDDTVSFTDANDAVTITFDGEESGTYSDDDGDSGSFSEIEAFELTDEADTVFGGANTSGVTISGLGGDDSIVGGVGNDDLDGGIGSDTISGNEGSDTIDGGDGADTLFGGGDDDTITVGAGDNASGDGGDDLFLVDPTSTGTSPITIIGGETGEDLTDPTNGSDGDTLDLSQLYSSGLIRTGSLNFTPGDPESGQVTLNNGTVINFSEIENFVCFTAGTMIKTPRGPQAIETLKLGDYVSTKDHGAQMLRWMGMRTLPALGRLAPIKIKTGALNNSSDLLVSPQHRMLIKGWKAELMFGAPEVLVPASHLVNGDTIFTLEGGTVEYVHILFDRHEIITANGAESESFHPGEQGFDALTEDVRDEVLTIFPELRHGFDSYGPTARPTVKKHEAALLAKEPGLLT